MSQLYDAGNGVESTIINRMLIEDDLARLRREASRMAPPRSHATESDRS